MELLLPKTTPAKGVANWTVKGVIAAAKASQGGSSAAAAAPAQPKPKEPAKKAAPPQPPVDPAKAAAAAAAKAAGDAAFAKKDYEGAIAGYTEALEHDPSNAAVWSNRSLCRYNVRCSVCTFAHSFLRPGAAYSVISSLRRSGVSIISG